MSYIILAAAVSLLVAGIISWLTSPRTSPPIVTQETQAEPSRPRYVSPPAPKSQAGEERRANEASLFTGDTAGTGYEPPPWAQEPPAKIPTAAALESSKRWREITGRKSGGWVDGGYTGPGTPAPYEFPPVTDKTVTPRPLPTRPKPSEPYKTER